MMGRGGGRRRLPGGLLSCEATLAVGGERIGASSHDRGVLSVTALFRRTRPLSAGNKKQVDLELVRVNVDQHELALASGAIEYSSTRWR